MKVSFQIRKSVSTRLKTTPVSKSNVDLLRSFVSYAIAIASDVRFFYDLLNNFDPFTTIVHGRKKI